MSAPQKLKRWSLLVKESRIPGDGADRIRPMGDCRTAGFGRFETAQAAPRKAAVECDQVEAEHD
jgi:hypothetical protein